MRPRMRGFPERFLPIILIALLLGLGGCGDGEEVSAEELVSRGDAICGEGQARFSEIQAEPPANPKEAVEQTEELIAVAEGQLEDLEGLEPPEDLREAYDRYLEEWGQAIELMKRGRDAAERRDAAGYGEAQEEAEAERAERLKLARQLGFGVCSERNP